MKAPAVSGGPSKSQVQADLACLVVDSARVASNLVELNLPDSGTLLKVVLILQGAALVANDGVKHLEELRP